MWIFEKIKDFLFPKFISEFEKSNVGRPAIGIEISEDEKGKKFADVFLFCDHCKGFFVQCEWNPNYYMWLCSECYDRKNKE
jgi:hypothetical protein